MTPLIRSMKTVLGPVPLLEYLESFRYPLAGECSMTTELVRVNRIPADWDSRSACWPRCTATAL